MKDTLRILRQQKNVTQEALAKHLGITPQSVGKWERGEGLPDITLLPNIALYFDVTVDELLNVDQARIEEKIAAYHEESMGYKNKGETDKDVAMWERAYAEFPNDCRVMHGLMYALEMGPALRDPVEATQCVISLGKEILQNSTDTKLREGAIQCLCLAYKRIGDIENALYYAEMGGNMHVSRENLRAHVLEGEEGIKACQQYIATMLHDAAGTANRMVLKGEFVPEEEIAIYQFGIDLMELLFADGNAGFYAHDLSWRYFAIARIYAEAGDRDNTLAALEQSVKYAVLTTEADKAPVQYTAPMVNRLKITPQEITKNYKGNSCDLRLEGLKQQRFDFLREDSAYQRLVNTLKAHGE